jgi:hypothetical protein
MTEILKEKWTQWAALTTTILAVCAAISAARGGSMSTRTMVTTTKEVNSWAHFQAKSITQHVTGSQLELLTAQQMDASPERRAWLDQKITACRDDLARYDKEKAEIQKQAEGLASQADFFKVHAGMFSVRVMLLQIAIMMNSVGALLKRKAMWLTGVGLGAIGVVNMLRGFFL